MVDSNTLIVRVLVSSLINIASHRVEIRRSVCINGEEGSLGSAQVSLRRIIFRGGLGTAYSRLIDQILEFRYHGREASVVRSRLLVQLLNDSAVKLVFSGLELSSDWLWSGEYSVHGIG